MNKVQKDYIKATAMLEAIEAEEREFEESYCKSKGYNFKNIFAIEDEKEFDKANEELSELEQQNGLWSRVCEARERKIEAEQKLIEYALSIIPFAKEREILKNASKTNWKARQEMIDIVMKLDTRTVTA